MTVFADFRPFFNAMIHKMRAKDKEKGDSWKDKDWVKTVIGTSGPIRRHTAAIVNINDDLRTGLKKETKEYFESLDVEELPDIANFCAMLWMRKNRLWKDQN